MEDSETEEEGDIEDCSSDGDDDDDEDSSTTDQESDATSTREFSPCEDERQCKMGWEKRRKHGAVVESGYQSDDGGNADDGRREEEEDSDVDYSSASSSDDASWEDDSDREASEQGEQVGSEEEEDSTESDSESESENESEDDEGGQSRPGCTKEKEKGKEKEDSKGRFYNFYRNSLFREQQRLSSGLISPRKGLMLVSSVHSHWSDGFLFLTRRLWSNHRDRRAWTAEMVLHRNSMLVQAAPEWWKLQQASDYELFNEFRSFKTIVQTPRGGYKAEDSPRHQRRPLLPVPPVNLGGVGRREPAESEPVGELTPRREGDWVSPDSGRETTTVTAAADSGFIDDAAQLRLPPNGGIVGAAICAAAAVAGASQRSDATDAPYPGAPLHDSFAFKSLLQKEGQRKERTDRDMGEAPSLLADDWKRGLKVVLKEGKEAIIGGEVDRLMSHLADCEVQDRQFVDDFLCSYRSFAQPQELLDFLIDRYNLPPPSVAKDMELSISQSAAEVSTSMSSGSSSSHLLYDKYLPLLQLRVLNVMRKWLANHFYDFEDDPRLLARMLNFVENTLRVHQPNEQHYEAIKSLVLEQAREVLVDKNSPLSEILVVMEREDMGVATQIFHKKGKKYVRSFNGMDFVDWCRDKLGMDSTAEAIALGNKMIQQNIIRSLEKRDRRSVFKVASDLFYRFSRGGRLASNPPIPRIPNRIPTADKLEMMDIDAIELARQFTLYSESLYRQITPTRLVGYMHAHRKMAITSSFLGIFNFLNRWDEVAKWATREVLSYRALPQRVAALRKLVNLAKACFGYNNFFDMSAILCGLNHSSINRLKKTWKLVNKKEKKVFDELSSLISPDNSYKLLREMQREAWTENFNKAERYTVALSRENDAAGGGGDKRKSGSDDEVYGLIPYIAIYIIDLEHLSQVPEVIANGMVNFAKKKIEASIFSEMIKFREHKYNFVPIEPYREWVEDIPVRGFGIFSSAESTPDHQEASAAAGKQKKKHNKTGSGDNSKASKSKSEIVGRHKEKVAPDDDNEVNAERDDPCKAPESSAAGFTRSDAAQVEEWEGEGSRRDKREWVQQRVVPYNDKLLWEVSLLIEPRPS
ncbi:RasGEF domain containing protein [Acanthamoeba castellanii str. Neff]|uniref:RasGEF domain containing protein n=1 Tax=Acanthamoeba castellanii (strain ATCC 30010 / Neff) TaxID=1257118 RepID=L8GY17_ACACF|nr:RasGEF domain containing protein [Acanthamoeba castellanii str. Neff]ELR17895.1 RasGEF domain containing protein [Acanthamoeba castellanii str. Neff]